jgi:hypothetical protein
MSNPNHRSKAPGSHSAGLLALLAVFLIGFVAHAADLASRSADRAAIERVYYNHRTGTKPPFEQTLPPATLETLVREDFAKEAALKEVYGVEISPALLEAEVGRINTTTRAPDMLAEIKTALGNDPVRFANTFAKPILVERLLRQKFENDDTLHAPQRRQIEQVRATLLAAKNGGAGAEKLVALLKEGRSNEVSEATWQLGSRPAEASATGADEMEIRKKFGPNAQLLSSPSSAGRDEKPYFEDLPGDLQNVLRAQLRRSGDISAVIETPGGFLLYMAKEKTDTALGVASLSVPKRSYEQWLEERQKDRL